MSPDTSQPQSGTHIARAFVLRGNARTVPLPDASVDLIVTSPPFFGMRSYTDGGEHYEGQVGAEATPTEFLTALLDCTREWMRVLKPTGSLWVNLGDKYSQRVAAKVFSHQSGVNPDHPGVKKDWKRDRAAGLARMPYENVMNAETGFYVPEKSLMGLPWRYALGCIDQLGMILRAELIWSKPNGMPESVQDRVRRSHEQWFHLTPGPHYFADLDRIREPSATSDPSNPSYRANGKSSARRKDAIPPGMSRQSTLDNRGASHPLGKIPGSVWTIATQPLRVPAHLGIEHFAAFPMEWPRRLILGWSPPGGVVLDPFGGTGTTALVASVHGRTGISIDLSSDYCRLARWRVNDPAQRRRALGSVAVPLAPPVPAVDMFEEAS